MLSPIAYPAGNERNETLHTLTWVRPVLRPGDTVLDIGCGAGYVLAELADEHPVMGVDIVNLLRVPLPRFALFDGLHLPGADRAFDVVLLTFVLHHVPNERKVALVREAVRVARRNLVILEDTPRTLFDRIACSMHGRMHRRRIGSRASFGFYDQGRWERFFDALGLRVVSSRALPRFGRDRLRPWARSAFVLELAQGTEG
jgi:ubiquinone/menaquinone biosynthesis C-methylase UbiE